MTKRGDLEVLAFNMIHWLCSTLPWEQVIAMDKKGKEKTVEEMKIKFIDNILEGLNSLKFPPTEKGIPYIAELHQFANYIILFCIQILETR